MQAPFLHGPGDRLKEAKRRLDRWRGGRRRPGRIPTELRRLAAEAAAGDGVFQAAAKLGLSPDRLEQWIDEFALRRAANSSGAAFVELAPVPWAGVGECWLEMEDPSGRKLRVRLQGSAVSQIAAVATSLCALEKTP